jgi:hypothetical protein
MICAKSKVIFEILYTLDCAAVFPCLTFPVMGRAIQAIMLLMLAGLTACVTNDTAPSVLPVARGQASVTISRPNAWYGAAVAVDIDANGARLASLAAGGSFTGPVPPGPVTLTVTCWSSPGRYTIHFNAEAGRRYAFEVSGRDEQVVATVAFGLIGAVADTVINDETSGAFKIAAVAK